ncbi:MAG TPA: Hsp20/alpha crystallin family protein [Anaeromyxobacteraceae bacterium]|nr:Hsp20/alpha crystallin family protein [Anaeromyxobacteraceae bacterium]
MATALKKEEPKVVREPRTEVVPARSFLPELSERFEELLAEPFGMLRWPIRWPELGWPHEMMRMPVMDIFEEGDTVVVKAEVPGLAKSDLDIRLEGDVLTVSGKKEKEEKVERKDYHRYERASGSFTRSVRLPAEVEAAKVTAALREGVLEIRAPKSEAAKAKSRKIEVA